MPKHIFVTGGVASSLGKGLTASSLGRLLKHRGLSVTLQKLDPYINIDPGTMNLERDHWLDLSVGTCCGTTRRLPRQDRSGHSAHH